MLSHWGGEGRPGMGGGFDSSHRPVVGTFDRFNGLSSNMLLTFSCYFDNPHMPCGGAFKKKLSAQFKCPAYACINIIIIVIIIIISYGIDDNNDDDDDDDDNNNDNDNNNNNNI